jgi:hypothetical protein
MLKAMVSDNLARLTGWTEESVNTDCILLLVNILSVGAWN